MHMWLVSIVFNWCDQSDMIVWLLGLVFVTWFWFFVLLQKKLHCLPRSCLLNGCRTLSAGSVIWQYLIREPYTFHLWHPFSLFTIFLWSILWAGRKMYFHQSFKSSVALCNGLYCKSQNLSSNWTRNDK